MRVYFSGGRGLVCTPEALVPERKPHIMLTFHDIDSNGTLDRLNAYLTRKGHKPILKKEKKKRKPVTHPIHSQSVFMDSGAYSLYGIHVGERRNKQGKEGYRNPRHPEGFLDRQKKRIWGSGDYSFYNLKPGSEFRKYCDRYAKWMKRLGETSVLFTTVDAIMNPEISWKTQLYFENEHGVKPIPVLHGGTPLRYLDRYLEAGRYEMLGLGGLGHLMRISTYRPWADEVFRLICPRSNNYLPLVRVHGFAMTSWQLMSRWPWWSVDSATWIKLAAYGWMVIPQWTEESGFIYDRPPIQLNMSRKPTKSMTQFWWNKEVKHPRQIADQHYDNCPHGMRENADRWIHHLGVPMGSYKKRKGKFKILGDSEVKALLDLGEAGLDDSILENGVTTCFKVRARVNLEYFKNFEQSRPKWPHPLGEQIIKKLANTEERTLGL